MQRASIFLHTPSTIVKWPTTPVFSSRGAGSIPREELALWSWRLFLDYSPRGAGSISRSYRERLILWHKLLWEKCHFCYWSCTNFYFVRPDFAQLSRIYCLETCWSRSSNTWACFVLGLGCSPWACHSQLGWAPTQAVIARTFLLIRKQWNCLTCQLKHQWHCAAKEM